jgi:hypothetical protein
MLICSRLYDFVHFPLQVVVRDKLSPMDRSLVSFLAYKAFDKDTFPDKPHMSSRKQPGSVPRGRRCPDSQPQTSGANCGADFSTN